MLVGARDIGGCIRVETQTSGAHPHVWQTCPVQHSTSNVHCRVVPGAAEPVRMLRCAYGEVDGLLVLGGQEAEQPEVLTLVPLAGSGKVGTAARGCYMLRAGGLSCESGAGNGLLELCGSCAHLLNMCVGLAESRLSSLRQGGDTGEVSDEEAEEDEDDEDEEGQGVQRRIRGLGASKGGSKEQPAPFRLPWFGNLIGFCLLPEGGSVTGGYMRRSVLSKRLHARMPAAGRQPVVAVPQDLANACNSGICQ